jgi:AraC-like DNA-binding protein
MTRPPVSPPRGILGRGAGARPSAHQRVAPSPSLAGSIAHFWTVSWDLRGQAPERAETLPHPSVHVIFEGRRAEVAGVTTGKFSRMLDGRGSVFGIKFRPAAFQPLLGAPLATLTDRVVPVRAIFGAPGVALARALAAAPRLDEQVRLAEAFLDERVAPLPAPVARIRDLVERLAVDRELVRVEQVAELAELDVRALQRQFRAYVGVSPKWVIGRYRLHEAAAQLDADATIDLAGLALQLGYFDQAHFIRDFKAVVGRAPGRYARAGDGKRANASRKR